MKNLFIILSFLIMSSYAFSSALKLNDPGLEKIHTAAMEAAQGLVGNGAYKMSAFTARIKLPGRGPRPEDMIKKLIFQARIKDDRAATMMVVRLLKNQAKNISTAMDAAFMYLRGSNDERLFKAESVALEVLEGSNDYLIYVGHDANSKGHCDFAVLESLKTAELLVLESCFMDSAI